MDSLELSAQETVKTWCLVPVKFYDINWLKVYSLKGTDTTFFDIKPTKSFSTGYDSMINVRFFPLAETAYMRLSNNDIVTLTISYKSFNTRCCGVITEITKFRLNKQ